MDRSAVCLDYPAHDEEADPQVRDAARTPAAPAASEGLTHIRQQFGWNGLAQIVNRKGPLRFASQALDRPGRRPSLNAPEKGRFSPGTLLHPVDRS